MATLNPNLNERATMAPNTSSYLTIHSSHVHMSHHKSRLGRGRLTGGQGLRCTLCPNSSAPKPLPKGRGTGLLVGTRLLLSGQNTPPPGGWVGIGMGGWVGPKFQHFGPPGSPPPPPPGGAGALFGGFGFVQGSETGHRFYCVRCSTEV